MCRIKESLCCQFFLQLLKSSIEITYTVHGHGIAVELIGSVSGIDSHLTHSNDLHTVFRTESKTKGIALKHDASQLAVFIFQCEVMVTGGIEFIIADLTTYGNSIQ